jgi:hypothetical protein
MMYLFIIIKQCPNQQEVMTGNICCCLCILSQSATTRALGRDNEVIQYPLIRLGVRMDSLVSVDWNQIWLECPTIDFSQIYVFSLQSFERSRWSCWVGKKHLSFFSLSLVQTLSRQKHCQLTRSYTGEYVGGFLYSTVWPTMPTCQACVAHTAV